MKLNIAIISCFIFIGIVSYHGAGARVITPYEMNVKKLTNSLFRKKNADRSLFPRFKSRRLSNSTCCVEKRWNPAEVNSVVATYLYGDQDGPCLSLTFRDCSDQFRSQQPELCANVTSSDDYHSTPYLSMSEIQRKCTHFERGECGTYDKSLYASFPGTPEMCAELSSQEQGGGGPPRCETKQDCIDTLPPQFGLLKDSIVCGSGAPYGVTYKSCFQACKMQPDGTHTVEMQNASSTANCDDFAARVGWPWPVVCSNFNSTFEEPVCHAAPSVLPSFEDPSNEDPSSCSIHGLSDLYSNKLPSGESCPNGCHCCKADGSCGECHGNYICDGDGYKTCTSCDVKFAGNQSAIDMCHAGAGPGFTAADGVHYDNSCGGDAPPTSTPNWDKCVADKKLMEVCNTPTDITTIPGFDAEKWGTDPAYAMQFLNQHTALKSDVTCYCQCDDEMHEVWPIGKTVCMSLTSSNGDCSGDACCRAGTRYEDGKCVASYEDIQNACKDNMKNWECRPFSDNSCDQ